MYCIFSVREELGSFVLSKMNQRGVTSLDLVSFPRCYTTAIPATLVEVMEGYVDKKNFNIRSGKFSSYNGVLNLLKPFLVVAYGKNDGKDGGFTPSWEIWDELKIFVQVSQQDFLMGYNSTTFVGLLLALTKSGPMSFIGNGSPFGSMYLLKIYICSDGLLCKVLFQGNFLKRINDDLCLTHLVLKGLKRDKGCAAQCTHFKFTEVMRCVLNFGKIHIICMVRETYSVDSGTKTGHRVFDGKPRRNGTGLGQGSCQALRYGYFTDGKDLFVGMYSTRINADSAITLNVDLQSENFHSEGELASVLSLGLSLLRSNTVNGVRRWMRFECQPVEGMLCYWIIYAGKAHIQWFMLMIIRPIVGSVTVFIDKLALGTNYQDCFYLNNFGNSLVNVAISAHINGLQWQQWFDHESRAVGSRLFCRQKCGCCTQRNWFGNTAMMDISRGSGSDPTGSILFLDCVFEAMVWLSIIVEKRRTLKVALMKKSWLLVNSLTAGGINMGMRDVILLLLFDGGLSQVCEAHWVPCDDRAEPVGKHNSGATEWSCGGIKGELSIIWMRCRMQFGTCRKGVYIKCGSRWKLKLKCLDARCTMLGNIFKPGLLEAPD